MISLNLFLKKLGFSFLLAGFLCSACFSEKTYTITESELNQILQEAENLKSTATELKNQSTQLQELSLQLKNEAQQERQKADFYKSVAVGACAASVILGGALYLSNR